MWWVDPVELLISCRLNGTILDSKSFLRDKTEYLPAGGFTVTLTGPQRFALAQPDSGYKRNVAQTWQELKLTTRPHSFEVCFDSFIPALLTQHKLTGVLITVKSKLDRHQKVAEEQGLVETMNKATSSLSASHLRNTDNTKGKNLLKPLTPRHSVETFTLSASQGLFIILT